MKRTAFAGIALCLAATGLLVAGEVAGVKMADTATVEGKTLRLNGMGLRTKFLFKVYVAGLYLETPSKDAAEVLSSDQIKSMRLSMRRSLSGSKITEAIGEGFERNSKTQLPALKARLDRLNKMIPDLKESDEIALTYLPGTGTKVTALGTDRGVLEGRDFADALFAVWLGPNPVQGNLKKALLGG